MQLPKPIRTRLADEFKFAVRGMREANAPLRKLYFFSVFYGEAGRALNWSWSPDLALFHQVMLDAYTQINIRATAVVAGADQAVGLPAVVLQSLTDVSSQIADLFDAKQIDETILYRLLVKVAEITYASGGNGHYLLEKGAIKLGAS